MDHLGRRRDDGNARREKRMSRRLIGSVLRDLRIQLRHGYPWIAALASLACIAAFAQIPQGNSDRVAPFASLAFSFFTTLPFLLLQVAGERRDGTLAMLDLTPLRPHEYLASKAISLAIPSVAMNTVMVLVSRGPYFNPALFWMGLALSGCLSACLAFLIAAWSGNAAKALAFSGLAGMALLLPVLPGIGFLPRGLLRLQPMAGPAGLIAGSYTEASFPARIIDASSACFWVVIALAACRKGFARFRIRG
jgi:fluoroquinolone transport system permease protein